MAKELLAYHLISLQNIDFLVRHVRNMRQAIIEGTLRDYAAEFLPRYLRQDLSSE